MSLVKLKTMTARRAEGEEGDLHEQKSPRGFPGGHTGEAKDLGSIPELGRSPGEGSGKPLQCSGLDNSVDRGAWQATVHEVTKSQTWLSNWAKGSPEATKGRGKGMKDWRDEVCQGSSIGTLRSRTRTRDEMLRKLLCCSMRSESKSDSVVSRSLPPHSIYVILQARILEWIAFPFSRGSSQLRDQTQTSHTAGRFFTNWAIREAQHEAREVKK